MDKAADEAVGKVDSRAGAPPIRTLATIVAALLLASGLLVAGYALLLSLGRDTLSTPALPPSSDEAPELGKVERLPPYRDARVFAAPASAARSADTSGTPHEVTLTHGEFDPEAGIAAFATDSGRTIAWLPLHTGQRTKDGWHWQLRLPRQAVTLSLAATAQQSRHSYLARVDLPAGDSRPAATHFEVGASPAALKLPPGIAQAGPFRLVRKGDADWRYPSGHGLFLPDLDGHRLGHGSYELIDPIDPDLRQRFEVPGSGGLTIAARLARPRSAPR